MNFESYNIEDDDEKPGRETTMWALMPGIMISPARGWARAKTEGPEPDLATIRFLLPLCLAAGASEFFALIYHVQLSLADLLVNAVINFCAFFLGYYIAIVLCKLLLPKDTRNFPTTRFGRLMTMAAIATLAIFHILFEALPMFDFIIEFFPLWTVFILYKGLGTADISHEKFAYSMGVICVVIICSPPLVEWVFSLFT